MPRVLRWLWNRISDFCTAADILEWIGWKGWVSTLAAGVLTTITLAMNDAPLRAVISLGIVSMACVIGGLLFWQNLRRPHSTEGKKPSSPLIVECHGHQGSFNHYSEIHDPQIGKGFLQNLPDYGSR